MRVRLTQGMFSSMPALGAGGLVFISSRDFARRPLFLPVPALGSLPVEGSPFPAKGTQPVSLQASEEGVIKAWSAFCP